MTRAKENFILLGLALAFTTLFLVEVMLLISATHQRAGVGLGGSHPRQTGEIARTAGQLE
jgi:hypothetical protein